MQGKFLGAVAIAIGGLLPYAYVTQPRYRPAVSAIRAWYRTVWPGWR